VGEDGGGNVSELKRLWSDLEFYDPIGMDCGKCVEKYHNWVERRQVRDFLNCLNMNFEPIRAALYGSGNLPSLEQAISAIVSEETRLKMEESGGSSASHGCSALFAGEIIQSFGRCRRGVTIDTIGWLKVGPNVR
jgi:hypothetical protein